MSLFLQNDRRQEHPQLPRIGAHSLCTGYKTLGHDVDGRERPRKWVLHAEVGSRMTELDLLFADPNGQSLLREAEMPGNADRSNAPERREEFDPRITRRPCP